MPDQTRPAVCAFESRRSEEMGSLIERFGGQPFIAPSMQEISLQENPEAIDAIRQFVDGRASAMILMTGVGTEAMVELAETIGQKDALLSQMKQTPLLIRGPKPAAVLNRLGLKYSLKAPEPNTWRELVSAIDQAKIPLTGQTIAVQEYGVATPELYNALATREANVLPIPVYRWALPDDIGPLQKAVHLTIDGQFDILLFTSAQQVRHVLQIAEQMEKRQAWLNAANRCLVASIGPTCTEALQQEGLAVCFEASPPKMGPLVRGAVDKWNASRQ